MGHWIFILLNQLQYEVPIQNLVMWLKNHGGVGQNQQGYFYFQPNSCLKCSCDIPVIGKYGIEVIENQTLGAISCHHSVSEIHTKGT